MLRAEACNRLKSAILSEKKHWKKYEHVIAAIAEELARKIGTWPPLTVIEPASSFAGPKLEVRGTFRKALFTRISQVSLTVRTCGSALMKPSRTALATWKRTAPAELKTKTVCKKLWRRNSAACLLRAALQRQDLLLRRTSLQNRAILQDSKQHK